MGASTTNSTNTASDSPHQSMPWDPLPQIPRALTSIPLSSRYHAILLPNTTDLNVFVDRRRQRASVEGEGHKERVSKEEKDFIAENHRSLGLPPNSRFPPI
ncbi:hypothetical protein D9756_009156 [Leucocoprinus leucothites]|uniref:Uncharacterized protein n=1 Tax=Leucocoprinus leucothites TaxID=201217 RepID=A0A8H5CXV1_9AGAR|nr:hypothetical protein D9756_009156 [Leucoagaricus leucothites]